ncbi:hypothetical protein CDL15_Pgr000340 [Punica granatum]|uniref:Uncharacterized protein n=1 Tax=Punica granatum TaxID=22663 RepID=A0A218XSI7_PUNGR|nr:hypothetical protein CDL15_Pgr000340 [Punica granatum]
MSPSNVTMRALSVEVDGAQVSGDGTGGGTAPECVEGAPAGVGDGALNRSSTALGERATTAVESTGSKRGPGEDVYHKVRESSLRKSRLVGEFLIFLSSLPAKVIDFAVGENTMMVVPGVRDVLASVSILVCGDSVGSSCADGLCRNANQETECGIPYQDENKIDLRLINANGILILKIYMMHVCENVNAYGLIHVTRILVLLGAVIVFLLMAFQTVCSAYSCPRLFMSSGSS